MLQSATQDTVRPEVGCRAKIPRRMWLKNHEKGICSAARHSGTECAEAREVFELERVVSCCSGDRRWRTKLNFSSGEPFDDHHRPTTLGAAIKIRRVFGRGSLVFGLWFLCRAEQLKAKRQESGTLAVGQETEVTNAHETLGEQVQEEAAQELVDR